VPRAAQAFYASYTAQASFEAAEGCFRLYATAKKWPGAMQWLGHALSLAPTPAARLRLLNEKARVLQNELADFDAAQLVFHEVRAIEADLAEQQRLERQRQDVASPPPEPTAAPEPPVAAAPEAGQRPWRPVAVGAAVLALALLLVTVRTLVAKGDDDGAAACLGGAVLRVTPREDGLKERGCFSSSGFNDRVDLLDSTGAIVGFVTYVDNRRTGRASEPVDGGVVTAHFVEGKLQGSWELRRAGVLVERREYVGNKPSGVWEQHDGSRLVRSQTWANGTLNGVTKHFHPNGKLAREEKYENGVRVGRVYTYSELGVLLDIPDAPDEPAPANTAEPQVVVAGSELERLYGGRPFGAWRSAQAAAELKGVGELLRARAERAGLHVLEDGGLSP
jgi:hypothetical protein